MKKEETLRSFADLQRLIPKDPPAKPGGKSEPSASKIMKNKNRAERERPKVGKQAKHLASDRTAAEKKAKSVRKTLRQTASAPANWEELPSTENVQGTTIPTIRPDRQSLFEFDRRLAAGPDVPRDLPNADDIEAVQQYQKLSKDAVFGHAVEVTGDRTDVIIGLDVGSTATKVVLRLPFSEDIGLPVPAPTWFRADAQPYYWRTLLWRSPSGMYSLEPSPDALPLDRLKVDLFSSDRGDRLAIRIAMVAWVVLMARQGIGWLAKTRPALFARGPVVIDEINLGMPFTKVEEANEDQELVANASGRILEDGQEVSDSAILRALEECTTAPSDLVSLQPELAGALHGFLRSHQSREGHYLLADIGGLTIDTVFFDYRENANPPISVYAKSVECFGSNVVSLWCKEVGTPERAVKVLGNHVAEVAKSALKEKILISVEAQQKPFELETILIGGGRHSQPHKDSIGWCEYSMRNHGPPLDLRLRELEPDLDDLDVPLANGQSVGRLLVAMGLSYSRFDMPDIRPPSELPDVRREDPRDFSERYVGPEQC